jgi:hypothetical protein
MGEGERNGDPLPVTRRPAQPALGSNEIAFEAYGVRLALSADRPEILERMRDFLPPGSQPCSPASVERRFSLTLEDNGTYALTRDGKRLAGTGGLQLDLALELFDSQLRIYLGRTAPDAIFIHAGAVAHRGRAIVMPSASFGGKTTLVEALVKAGAVYYSDEFAVIDREGLVHPYAKPLSVRDGGWEQTHHDVESLGWVAGDEPVLLGMIVITTYRPGAKWNPKRLSAGAGAMALLANAVPAQERPQEVLQATSRAAKDSIVIESNRDEADAIAPQLLAELERHGG